MKGISERKGFLMGILGLLDVLLGFFLIWDIALFQRVDDKFIMIILLSMAKNLNFHH